MQVFIYLLTLTKYLLNYMAICYRIYCIFLPQLSKHILLSEKQQKKKKKGKPCVIMFIGRCLLHTFCAIKENQHTQAETCSDIYKHTNETHTYICFSKNKHNNLTSYLNIYYILTTSMQCVSEPILSQNILILVLTACYPAV